MYLSHNACERVLYSRQLFDLSVTYTIEKGVVAINTASDYCIGHRYGGVPVRMFVNAPKLAHKVVVTLYYKVDVRDKVEMWTKITPRFQAVVVGEIWLPKISIGKEDVKFLVLTLVAYE